MRGNWFCLLGIVLALGVLFTPTNAQAQCKDGDCTVRAAPVAVVVSAVWKATKVPLSGVCIATKCIATRMTNRPVLRRTRKVVLKYPRLRRGCK